MQVNTKTHTDISVTDNSTDVTVYAPDPLEARKSLDGTKVIFHEELITPVIRERSEIKSYLWDSKELHEILNSEEWTIKENLNYDI